MAPKHGTPRGDFDERLEQALKSALLAGEQLVAREEGDQGQAIALTDSRILIVRVGLTATGEVNGQKSVAFPLSDVTAVNLRKGPLGAVIQVALQNQQAGAPSGPPNNVIVFTGPGRVKKAEAFAAMVESAGKIVNRTGPQVRPEQPAEQPPIVLEGPKRRGDGREKKTLAEEMYSQPAQPGIPPANDLSARAKPEPKKEPAVVPPTPEEIAAAAAALDDPAPVVESVQRPEPEPEPPIEEEEVRPKSEFNPNPRLPKPVRKRQSGPNRVLVAMGVLASMLFVGMAVIAPLHENQHSTAPSPITADAAGDLMRARLQLNVVSSYAANVKKTLAKADAEAVTIRSAFRSASPSSVAAASKLAGTDKAWQDINAMTPPPGLAAAHQDLVDGLVARKNAIAAAAGSADFKGAMEGFKESDSRIQKGMSTIDLTLLNLQRQINHMTVAAKKSRLLK